jgi:hypothetical protein
MLTVDMLRASYKIPEGAGLVTRIGDKGDKKSTFRSPCDTLMAIRMIIDGDNDFIATSVFLTRQGKWESGKNLQKIISNLTLFDIDLIESPRLEEYMGLMKQVKVFTRCT